MSGSSSRHCPHCWGNCPGTCLLPGLDACIHQAHRGPKLPRGAWPRVLRTRRFWRRVVFGLRAH